MYSKKCCFVLVIVFCSVFFPKLLKSQTTEPQQVSPCVNLTIHDLAPKIRHSSGADLLRIKGADKVVAVTMYDWQGKTAFQNYFIHSLRQQFPALFMERGAGYLIDYLYVTVEEHDSFTLADFQKSVKNLRDEIDEKEKTLGTEKCLAELEQLLK